MVNVEYVSYKKNLLTKILHKRAMALLDISAAFI